MDTSNPQAPNKAGPITKFLNFIAGVDEETLRQCPAQDWDNARAVGIIMICTWLYQSGLFSLISHRLFAMPGQIRPELVLLSMFLASFILLIDSYMVMRSGWHLSGIEELKRGGIDISGGSAARVKAGGFLGIRISLSACIAQLTAIFLGLLIFAADIDAHNNSNYLQANARLVPAATALVDADIQRAIDAVKAESAREATLAAQVARVRQNQIEPSANDQQIEQAEQEVSQLAAQQARADYAVQSAETFASNELGGIRADPRNSGRAGSGPRRRAAEEAVNNAKSRAQQVTTALNAARARLDALREQSNEASQAQRRQSRDQLPVFQESLAAEDARLAELKDQLAKLTRGRADAIREAVERAPDHVARDDGFLAQITALEHIAQADNKIALVILLIDLTSFGFELASVLAKVTSFVPTTYAALLARDAYMSAVHIVEGMVGELTGKTDAGQGEAELLPADHAAGDGDHNGSAVLPPDPFDTPAKRPRGRPRKNSLNDALS